MRNQKPETRNQKILLTGNEAIGEGAISSGCRFYAGYPITPQNELTVYMAKRISEAGGVFIQAESEISAINMVLGASAVGMRAMTSSSSPGISLKQEGISYLAGCQLPAVIVNIMRGGPGLGNIAPSQSDYFQAVKGGGHGDYHCIVLAPSSVQEAFSIMGLAFDLADRYRNPVIVLGDGMLGQMAEPIEINHSPFPMGWVAQPLFKGCGKNQKSPPNAGSPSPPKADSAKKVKNYKKPWALTGCKKRRPNLIKSFYIAEGKLEEFNLILQRKYREIEKREGKSECLFLEDSEIVLVSYGTMARICKSVVKRLRKRGEKIGLIRPITLWPFPKETFTRYSLLAIRYLVVEMSYGQMYEDVRLVVNGRLPVEFLGRSGGGIPTEEEIIDKIYGLKKNL